MPTIETRIATDQAERYLRQFCKHATAMGSPKAHRMRMHGVPAALGEVRLRVQQTETHATIHFDPWGSCRMDAAPGVLTVRIDAADDQALQRIRDTISRDLERFGRGGLAIDWTAADNTGLDGR